MVNLEQAKIYKIYSPSNNVSYIGSTTLPLNMRLSLHKTNKAYCSSKNVICYDDCKIELIEMFPCANKIELYKREGHHIKNTSGCVNMRIAGSFVAGSITNSATAGRIDASNDIVAYSTSDRRLKDNIINIENSINKLENLNGVKFNWKKEHFDIHGYEGDDVGVIAQEIEEVLPEAIRVNETGYLSVRYEKIIPLLIEGIKELSNNNKQQQNQIDILNKKIEFLMSKK
jgi:hypothetical protein